MMTLTEGTIRNPPEIWGGIECSIVRVGDNWRNQVVETGHLDRASDLDSIAALGIRTLRYPVLWEAVWREGPEQADWSWIDQRLQRLRDLRVDPIAGLCHHGSGPFYTSLIDPQFPTLLARHARAVAERYPWITRFTPVNEPLTTARFSCLYGHWYPHRQSNTDFARALINQCWATVLAMEAIRSVTPNAQLIQTEDLGRTFSTPRLAYQAEFENQRRWLSFDLLTGCLDGNHPLWAFLLQAGITAKELQAFQKRPCPPDMIGINHYVTSERFLDENIEHYPANTHGSNGHDVYADVEAIRVPVPRGSTGTRARLREVWQRYGLPIAITEVHLGCTRDEQLRWLAEVWQDAVAVRAEGADIRAITPWALLGSVDWNSLLTLEGSVYEPGVFDIRSPAPRPTALAAAIASLGSGARFDHPVLAGQPWWRRDSRFFPVWRPQRFRRIASGRPLLILGSGVISEGLCHLADQRGLAHRVLNSRGARNGGLRAMADDIDPWAIIYLSALDSMDPRRWTDDRMALTDVSRALAVLCSERDLPLLAFSSHDLFDGEKVEAYVERDAPTPNSSFGRSLLEIEQYTLQNERTLLVRTGTVIGAWDRADGLLSVLGRISDGERVAVDASRILSPVYFPDLFHAALDLLIDGETGIWHLSNQGAGTLYDCAVIAAQSAGLDHTLLEPLHAPVRNLALSSERGWIMPTLESALVRLASDTAELWRNAGARAAE